METRNTCTTCDGTGFEPDSEAMLAAFDAAVQVFGESEGVALDEEDKAIIRAAIDAYMQVLGNMTDVQTVWNYGDAAPPESVRVLWDTIEDRWVRHPDNNGTWAHGTLVRSWNNLRAEWFPMSSKNPDACPDA